MRSREFRTLMAAIMELKAIVESSKDNLSDEVLLDSTQMEKLLKCSPSTLQRLRNRGTIPYNKIGGRCYYPKNFFTQEFLNSIAKADDPSKRFDD